LIRPFSEISFFRRYCKLLKNGLVLKANNGLKMQSNSNILGKNPFLFFFILNQFVHKTCIVQRVCAESHFQILNPFVPICFCSWTRTTQYETQPLPSEQNTVVTEKIHLEMFSMDQFFWILSLFWTCNNFFNSFSILFHLSKSWCERSKSTKCIQRFQQKFEKDPRYSELLSKAIKYLALIQDIHTFH
jgi:hypothetical protein